MAVPEQTPYIEYTANGTTTNFTLTFDCDNSAYLIVTLNGADAPVGSWSLVGTSVVFTTAPLNGVVVAIKRDTPLERTTNYQLYDNSFLPTAVNKDLDAIWQVLQELNLGNSFTYEKLQELIDQIVEGNIDGLPAEILARIAGDEANLNLINAEALRAYAAEQALTEEIQEKNIQLNTVIAGEIHRATTAETNLQNQVDSIVVGNKAYKTYALMDADKTNIPVNSKVAVTNDPDPTKNIDWQWDGVTFTAAPTNVLTQAKTYTDTKMNAVIEETDSSVPPVSLVDVDGWFYGGFYEDGSMETPLFKVTNYFVDGFIIIDEDGWILLEQNTSTSAAKDWSQKKILLFGDSITETSNVEAGVYDSLAYRQNWLLYAFAMLEIQSFRNFARSGASYREYVGQLDWQKISYQVGVAISTGFTPDIVVIACGTNDGNSNLGDYDTAMSKNIVDLDMSLTAEALRKNLYTISQAYPNAKLFSCLPLQRADAETSTRQPLLDLIRKMSGRYGFTVIDCHNETGIVKDFEVWGSNGRDLSDGLHPKTSGQIKQAKLISAKIKSNYQLQV